MPETEVLSGLISDIYDTVLDDELWSDVLKKTAGFVGGPSAGLWSTAGKLNSPSRRELV